MNIPNLPDQILRRLPAILEARRVAAEEAVIQRRAILERLKSSQQQFERTEVDLAAKAKPLEQRLAALQAEVQAVRQKLDPLQSARRNAESSRQLLLHELHGRLRDIVKLDLVAFYNAVDAIRGEIGNNVSGRRDQILRRFKPALPMQRRIVEAMAITLEAARRAQQMAAEEEDFSAALDRLRKEIQAAGIEFVEE